VQAATGADGDASTLALHETVEAATPASRATS
jgi:hypothetical protein